MAKFFCKYCGTSYSDVRTLTSNSCLRHPDGPLRGKHAVYEGREKSEYVCKYCGQKYHDIRSMTSNSCPRDGPLRGKHSPML